MKKQVLVSVVLFGVVIGIGATSSNKMIVSWMHQTDVRIAALEERVGIEHETFVDGTMIGAEFGWSKEQQMLFDRVMMYQKDKHKIDAGTINALGSSKKLMQIKFGVPEGLTDSEKVLWADMIQKRIAKN